MAKSEAEILADVLRPPENGIFSRVTGASLTIITLIAVCALFAVSWAQMQALEAGQRAAGREAHERQAKLQQTLNSARLSQAITAEFQFASAGRTAPASSAACARAAAERVMIGRQGLAWADLSCLRDPGALSPADAAYVRAAAEVFSIERFVVPLDADPAALIASPAYAAAREAAKSLRALGDPRAALTEARVATAVLNAAGTASPAIAETQAACAAIAEVEAVPETSLEVFVWQAECLRKLAPDDREALRRFEAAQRYLGTLPGRYVSPGASLCETASDIGRTEATIAARVFNGLGMTLVTQGGDLDRAQAAIKEAVCLRRKAQQTPAQVASSGENLAVIAYRKHLAGEPGALGQVRSIARASLEANPTLVWSWVLLYVAETSSAEHDPEFTPAAILRRITYLDANQFKQPELEALLGPKFKAKIAVPGDGLFSATGAETAESASELMRILQRRREASVVGRDAFTEEGGEFG